MIRRSLLFWVALLWGVEMLLPALFPSGRLIVDPLFLLLAFLGFRRAPGRFLWLQGAALGFLKDLGTGAVLGGWACAFGLVGVLLGMGSRMVEAEDPFVAGVWVAVLHGAAVVIYALLNVFSDPALRGFPGPWFWLLLSMPAHGFLAAWGFPRLRSLLRRRAPVF